MTYSNMGLQTDVLNNLRNQKFYLEKDLTEILSGQILFPTYKEKEDRITAIIKEIAVIATAFNIVEFYIKENNTETNDGIN